MRLGPGKQIPRFARNDIWNLCDAESSAIFARINRKSSEAAGDIRLRARIRGRRKQVRRGSEFNKLAGEKKCGVIADAGGLLHVVGNDGDGAEIFQLHEEFFDFRRADRIERGARLIEE